MSTKVHEIKPIYKQTCQTDRLTSQCPIKLTPKLTSIKLTQQSTQK